MDLKQQWVTLKYLQFASSLDHDQGVHIDEVAQTSGDWECELEISCACVVFLNLLAWVGMKSEV